MLMMDITLKNRMNEHEIRERRERCSNDKKDDQEKKEDENKDEKKKEPSGEEEKEEIKDEFEVGKNQEVSQKTMEQLKSFEESFNIPLKGLLKK